MFFKKKKRTPNEGYHIQMNGEEKNLKAVREKYTLHSGKQW